MESFKGWLMLFLANLWGGFFAHLYFEKLDKLIEKTKSDWPINDPVLALAEQQIKKDITSMKPILSFLRIRRKDCRAFSSIPEYILHSRALHLLPSFIPRASFEEIHLIINLAHSNFGPQLDQRVSGIISGCNSLFSIRCLKEMSSELWNFKRDAILQRHQALLSRLRRLADVRSHYIACIKSGKKSGLWDFFPAIEEHYAKLISEVGWDEILQETRRAEENQYYPTEWGLDLFSLEKINGPLFAKTKELAPKALAVQES